MHKQLFLNSKKQALANRTLPIKSREEKLKQFVKAIESNKEDIANALKNDFNKPNSESYLTEIYPALKEIEHTIENLKHWASDKIVGNPLALTGARSYSHFEPKGVVLIIGPWNYPFQLIAIPLATAIAAGNTAIVKPSEFTNQINSVLKIIIKEVFSDSEVSIVEGDAETTKSLLTLPFDHIFFTGSTNVGKVVMRAAAEHLASVTLELGGKSPCIVDESANIQYSAAKIAWGKFINGGQTCIAPDYIFIHKTVEESFIAAFKKSMQKFYGTADALKNDLAHMVSDRHQQRLLSLIHESNNYGDQLLSGGTAIPDGRGIEPTLIRIKDLNSPLMKEELFGPIAPIIIFTDIDEVLNYINSHDKPLAAYYFSSNTASMNKFESETTSGGLVFNDCLVHLMNPELPFGGVNSSGIGRYHGQHGFKEFSHERAVVRQSILGHLLKLIFPPYLPWKQTVIKLMTKFKI